ncbi:aminodeoxychorismate lyase [Shewanella sp. AS16]|uniref:aminodeoxychorismate lyase n=1 Tax=Shewanella sp. AS16 TaxID=2907625 RepID=UPI001F28E39B|nr:aminodeoxychorismate lyase [Shewanella sp. AS16]MCE9684751.1 aminodeoxychorismate lyase [Shewanella sp. AS16]
MTQVWVNGQAMASVSPFDRGLAYGDGLFATMRVGPEGIAFFDAHMQRLQQGAARLGLDWHLSPELAALLHRLGAAHPHQCIKLVITRGVGGRGYAPPTPCHPTEIVSLHPIPEHYADWQRQGIRLCASEVRLGRQPLLAGIKHLNRLEQVLIRSAVLPDGIDDWLVKDSHHLLIASSMGNLFFVRENQVFTPALTACGVAGVMRAQVIMALADLGFNVIVADLNEDFLHYANHVFVTNSLFGIVDVLAIDRVKYPRAQFTASLRQTLALIL